MYVFELVFLFLPDICPGMELLGHMVVLLKLKVELPYVEIFKSYCFLLDENLKGLTRMNSKSARDFHNTKKDLTISGRHLLLS